MKLLATFLILWAAIYCAYVVFVNVDRTIAVARALNESEAQCIAKLISSGVERKSIAVRDGKCWIDGDE